MKYALNQLVYYILDDKLHSAPILASIEITNLHEDYAATDAQRKTFTPFGKAGVKYATCHGVLSEDKVFATKEDLAKSLDLV